MTGAGACYSAFFMRTRRKEGETVQGADTYKKGRNYENLNKGIFEGDGYFDIPALMPVSPEDVNVENWISFNYAKTCDEPEIHGVHFFVDDYQFQRLWAMPDTYLPMMRRFPVVMSPDFSTYTDFPKAIQIYNHYRKHWLAAYWQYNGIIVVPTISWSDEASFDWCFDGEPLYSVVAISAVGSQNSEETSRLFMRGYEEMLKRLRPTKIIFYGKIPDECMSDKVISIKAFQDALKQRRKEAEADGR